MKIVIDSNIIFSLLISNNQKMAGILLNSPSNIEFFSPSYMLDELEKHQDKLLKLSGFSQEDLVFIKDSILQKIKLIDVVNLPKKTWVEAFDLVQNVDENDTPLVALAIELHARLWTGDKKLTNGLIAKKFN